MRKIVLLSGMAVLAVGLVLWPSPAVGVSKEILQLQRDVALLQEQVRNLQQSVDRNNAALKSLVEQSLDAVNRTATAVDQLGKSVQQTAADTDSRVQSLSIQVQSLRDTVDEMGVRLGRIAQQLTETRNVMQSVDARLAAGSSASSAPAQSVTPAGQSQSSAAVPASAPTPTPESPRPSSVPAAETLYDSALRNFINGNYDSAQQQFSDYLRYYRQTKLAGNAQYYLGEVEYRRRQFDKAIKSYDKVLQEFSGSLKTAAAYLKKGYALLELNQREAGVALLRTVIEKFPRWDEANLARGRLERLGERLPR